MARKSTVGKPFPNDLRRAARLIMLGAVAGLLTGPLTGCGGNLAADDQVKGPKPGPSAKYNPKYDESVFGEGGLSLNNLRSGAKSGILGGDQKARLPVNKYIWQAALDTLSFLPLASTDPFTGVIATDWGTTTQAPNERFKVTVYVLGSELSAAMLKVAVYREVRSEDGVWLPSPVSAETARKLEDAILTRARQIRIAGLDEKGSG